MSEVQRLQDRIDELETILGVGRDDVAIYRRAFRLTPDEAKILGLIVKRSAVTREAMFTVLYGARPDCDQPEPKIVDVLICRMRKPLRVAGVTVKTDRGVGFCITAADKAKLRAFLASREEVLA